MSNKNTTIVSQEMEIINLDELGEIVEHVCLGQREVPMIVGPSGNGKTQRIEQKCAELGVVLVTVLLSQYDTVDLRGTPWSEEISPANPTLPKPSNLNQVQWDEDDQDQETMALVPASKAQAHPKKFTVWSPASTLPFEGNPNFPDDKPIVIFFDELTSATVPVMGICYQLVDKYCVGEHKLKPNVHIICAGNRESDKGIVNRMPKPLCNRMTWFETIVDNDVWSKYMARKHGKKAGIFIAFFQWKKNYLHNFDPSAPATVFATPRSVEKAFKYYTSTMPEHIKMKAMAGAMGSGVNVEFWGFVKIWYQVEQLMEQIKKDPNNAPIPTETSLQWATAVSISGMLTMKNCKMLYSYLKRMEPEYVIAAWQMAIARDKKLFDTDEFVDIAKRYRSIFTR